MYNIKLILMHLNIFKPSPFKQIFEIIITMKKKVKGVYNHKKDTEM